MDDGDKAQARAEETLADALADHHRRRGENPGPAVTECQECGDTIPEKRRLAAPGCRLCIDCQRNLELQLKRGDARA